MKNTYFITFQIENILGDKLIFREFININVDFDRSWGKFNQCDSIEDAILNCCIDKIIARHGAGDYSGVELLSVNLILTEE